MEQNNAYRKGFIPYALAAFLIGIVGGFSTVLGPSFVQNLAITTEKAIEIRITTKPATRDFHAILIFSTVKLVEKVLKISAGIKTVFSILERTTVALSGTVFVRIRMKPIMIIENKMAI